MWPFKGNITGDADVVADLGVPPLDSPWYCMSGTTREGTLSVVLAFAFLVGVFLTFTFIYRRRVAGHGRNGVDDGGLWADSDGGIMR